MLLVLILLAAIILLVVLLIKKYLRFRKTVVNQEELLNEVATLNREVMKLNIEKDKILAMKVSQLGLRPGEKLYEELLMDEEGMQDTANKLIHIGFGNMVNTSKIIAIVSPDSAPVKRMVQNAKEKGIAIDATQGRKTEGVIVTDSGHVVLSYFAPERITKAIGDAFDQEDEQ